jgi:hypothetical protein
MFRVAFCFVVAPLSSLQTVASPIVAETGRVNADEATTNAVKPKAKARTKPD